MFGSWDEQSCVDPACRYEEGYDLDETLGWMREKWSDEEGSAREEGHARWLLGLKSATRQALQVRLGLFDIVLPVYALVISDSDDWYLPGMHRVGTCCCSDSCSCLAGVLELQQDKNNIAECKASRRFKPY